MYFGKRFYLLQKIHVMPEEYSSVYKFGHWKLIRLGKLQGKLMILSGTNDNIPDRKWRLGLGLCCETDLGLR